MAHLAPSRRGRRTITTGPNSTWTAPGARCDAQKEQRSPHPAGYVAFHIDTATGLNPIGLAHRFRVDGELQVRL